MVSYDRPGIGQSDPQLKRTMNTSAEDMADIADAWAWAESFGSFHTPVALPMHGLLSTTFPVDWLVIVFL